MIPVKLILAKLACYQEPGLMVNNLLFSDREQICLLICVLSAAIVAA